MGKTIHGMKGTRFYIVWKNMKARCLNSKHPAFGNYGGRGITVCESWLCFENFKNDMYESYLENSKNFGELQISIDRINNNKGYFKENCRWATMKEQSTNQRQNKLFKAISPEGEEFIGNNQVEIAEKYNLNKSNINACLSGRRKNHKGWIFTYIEKEVKYKQSAVC